MFTEEEVECILKAGKIVKEVRGRAASIVREGTRVLEICERVEEEIRRLGGEPAFPCNVGIDNIGAHYTSPPGDETIIRGGALVKVDLGAHVDGFVADSAVTVSLGSDYEEMIGVAEEALERALETVRVGGRISDVGTVVERTIKSHGFKPISNLTGHQISRYTIHAGVSVPNVATRDSGKFEAWSLYAIEPFVTLPDAAGEVVNGLPGNILHVVKLKGPKDQPARSYFEDLIKSYKTLPFARRWVSNLSGYNLTERLISEHFLYEYPVLVERSGKAVAQAEHTLLTTDKEVIVIT
ncbi:MAG: type II methionyl aminopeptidase [Candidatus Methanomethylicota archaeon]|uniref:Methionine aminopeptidase n=1 Tax=Thermoproteota archaeon TaxID=2056631 RepID=A0A523BAS7_9CREN|nr:MAG: type II methionyl aminopeptidase [Candidatus Verstraetearchaeota archaeon]